MSWHLCGIFTLTNAAEFTLHLVAVSPVLLSGKTGQKACKLQQLRDAKERALLAHHHLGVRRDNVGPLRRN